ncbi:type IV pili methyl-accepting chemotaxis transducer N-terminal domain-containing protein [Neptuniibacter caesariensis]|uniref:Pilus assembly protein PilP n=1 Tax=Neptuniibacter caesariensis TaxID=207954 RepID=A0A7U8C9E2_NEPCE|nr:type IV pili methyl-accepting chemotaxis transducer N-terminal domain-containing protein [Neptuniibacter caesariensis]EAR62525.1 hypothetical protein MED92_05388 [Oceanospirillum sp. MED92] [Neptuniibacter caesariensis]
MRAVKLVVLALLMFSGSCYAEIKSIEQAINVTSNQGMLTQQMLKNYILMGLSVRARKAEQELHKAIDSYEAAQEEIQGYAKTDAVRDSLRRASAQWQVVKPLYAQNPSRTDAERVRQETELLLQLWSAVTMEIVENTDTKYGKAISTAGFIRMLSQRVSSHYALKTWGFEDKYQEAFVSSLQLFEQNRQELEGSQLNNEQIKSELNKIQRDFKRFKGLSDGETSSNKALLALLTRSAEKITVSMDKLTAMYMYQGLSF